MNEDVAGFVAALRAALAREDILTFGGGWPSQVLVGSAAWRSSVGSASRVLRLGFGEQECAHALEVTGASARSLWPEDPPGRAVLRLVLVHVTEELDTRVPVDEKNVVLTFPDGIAQVRADREPGPRD